MGQWGRYELKFQIDASVKARLLEAAGEALLPDPHGEDGLYRVTSQYYDTTDLEAFWEKIDGVAVRRKHRLRFYGAGTVFFLEVKHRVDQVVRKERVELDPESAVRRLEAAGPLGGLEALVRQEGRGSPTVGRVELTADRTPLLPVNGITYLREAWVGVVDPRLRVTFDHLCQALPPGDCLSSMTATGCPILPETDLILEVKFNRRLPRWLRDLMVGCGLQQIRFSKYAEGVLALADTELRNRVGQLNRVRDWSELRTADQATEATAESPGC